MPAPDPALLACERIRVSVPGRLLVDQLELSLQRCEFIAVLGQNGTGKSLTLMTLAGLRSPDTGRVLLRGDDIFESNRQQTARHLALLPQVIDDIFPATVIDTALIGRHPHIGRFRWESAEDHAIAKDALQAMGLSGLSSRDVLTLSGGERRRLSIAQVLTQAPEVYLLDEPTNHLDPQHQLDTLRIFRRAADSGAGVIASLHDVNSAVRFADRCLLLFGDGRWELGRSEDVLTESNLSELFATPMEAINWRSHKLFVATSDHEAL
ncbi:MAG: ABC transporter ATP-binding protein [Gammaproteobacteria bacterium]|nr:ABC transporter ATP-binding protein [Gammaproteobacteria bacterium]MDH3429304.1 ABC transporter ATP-binding protein [Gammaproteobacteria bacterium]MDH3432227.1 ABC transporter ATP-binding protein [Gammaproteobacteria bacterium]